MHFTYPNSIISFHFSSHRSQFYLLKNDERNFVPLHSWPHLQVLVEPGNGLAEGLLLGELEVRVAQVGADGESVGNTAVEVDLPGLTGLAQGFLGLVTELGGEDLVDFCGQSGAGSNMRERLGHTRSSNGQRTSDTTEFLVGDERGVSSVADVELSVLQEAADVLQPLSALILFLLISNKPLTLPPKQYPTPETRLIPKS